MTTAAVVLEPSRPARAAGGGRAGGRAGGGRRQVAAKLLGALDAGLDEVLAVITDEAAAAECPDGVTVLLDESGSGDEASLLRVAADWSARAGHDRIVVALGSALSVTGAAWRAVADADDAQIVVAKNARGPIGLVGVRASVFSLLPLEGGVEVLWRARPELARELVVETA